MALNEENPSAMLNTPILRDWFTSRRLRWVWGEKNHSRNFRAPDLSRAERRMPANSTSSCAGISVPFDSHRKSKSFRFSSGRAK